MTPSPNNSQSGFKVVIAGEGFTDAETASFKTLASELQKGLLMVDPFCSLQGSIQWNLVVVSSDQSGIPEKQSPRQRFFGILRKWVVDDSGEKMLDLNSPDEERVNLVKDCVASSEPIDLLIIIANEMEWAGHGWPELRTAVVGGLDPQMHKPGDGPNNPSWWIRLAAHECGHAICDLADERLTGTPRGYTEHGQPNRASLEEVAASVKHHLEAHHPSPPGSRLRRQLAAWNAKDTVWWRGFAEARTAPGTGGFLLAVHEPGDAWDYSQDRNLDPVTRQISGGIGAYWGCQNTCSPETLGRRIRAILGSSLRSVLAQELVDELRNAPKSSSRDSGALYYRPAANCGMRMIGEVYSTGHFFCPVCEHAIGNTIRAASGDPLVMPVWNP